MDLSKNMLRLSYDEYYMLMCPMGTDSIKATFADRYDGITEDAFAEMWIKCENSLVEKGHLLRDEASLHLNAGLYFLLAECIDARKVYNIQLTDSAKDVRDITYFEGNNTLVCIRNLTENEEVGVYLSPKKSEYETVTEKFIRQGMEDGEMGAVLTQQEYVTMMANANMGNMDKAKQVFGDAPEVYAIDLINALKKSCGMLSINEYIEDDVMNYNILSGEKFFWAVFAEGEDSVGFKLIKPDEVKEAIRLTMDYKGGN